MTKPELDPIVKAASYVPVSAELLAEGGYLVPELLHPPLKPMTAAERAEARRISERRDAELRARVHARHAANRARLDGQLLEVADLHGPVVDGAPWPVCEGCDGDGAEWEPPEWPCRTYTLVTGDAARAA